MGKVISINIQKGGCGKSTTVQALAGSLSKKGYKCLVIDLDPQGNLTFSSNILDAKYTIYDFLKGNCSFDEVVQVNKYYDIIPSNISLSRAEQEFNELTLKDALIPVKELYDYIIIDSPPSFNTLSINSLAAADYLISPIEPSFYAFQGLEQLYETVKTVQKNYNTELKFLGFLLVKYNGKDDLNKILELLINRSGKNRNIKLFKTRIRESMLICEAQGLQLNIYEHSPRSRACFDYQLFAEELLNDIQDCGIRKAIV